jgi:hypothetical protein
MRCDNNMVRSYLGKIAVVLCLSFVFTIVNFQQLNAQGVLGTEPQQVKWLSTSALRSWFSNMGAEGEYFRRDRTTYTAVDQIDGLCWPNEFNIRMKGVKAAKALWIGTTNFADPVSNATYPYKVVCIGKDAAYSGTEVFADELSLVGKFLHPDVYVDNTRASARDFDDAVDEVDNTQVVDRVMLNRFHTSIGVSVTRKVLSFSQQYNNNYYIYEYTFKNTGIIDESGQQKINIPLTGVMFYTQTRLSFAGVAYTGIGTTGPGGFTPATTSWGRNTITDVVGQDAAHTLPAPNNFRASFSYWGPMSTSNFFANQGDIGLPGPNSTNVTELAGYEFAGTVVLHADKASNDPTDDITQPKTTLYVGADNPIDRNQQPTQYNQNLMAQKYTQYMAGGHAPATVADQVGKDGNGWPTGAGNTFGTDAGGYMSSQGFGPYDLNPGDSVRIVVAEAVAGIEWNKACEVARNWFANNTSAFVLPSGYAALKGYTTATGANAANEYKNAWVFSGKDSLFQTFRRALANYNSNYTIPQPPPPPDKFQVNSGGDRIKISWSKGAESSPHFDGYRLYRSEGKTDTTYDLLFECGKSTGNLVNSYDDQNAKRGFNYYYYIQSKDDGTTNDIQPGEPLVSSRYYTMTNNPAFLTRPAGAALTSISNTFTFQGNDTTKNFIFPQGVSIADSLGTVVKGISVSVNGVRQIPALYTIVANPPRFSTPLRSDTLKFDKAPLGTIEVKVLSPTGDRNFRLSEIRVVPNPWNIHARNIQYGTTDVTTLDRLGFYNLPPMCRIKIYTELGDLIATIDHTNGSGDEYWQSLTSSRQLIVSGLYIAYFEVTENSSDGNYRKGDSIFKKFIIIR